MFGKKKATKLQEKDCGWSFLRGLCRGYEESRQRLSKEEEHKLWEIIRNSSHPQEIERARERIILAQYPLLTYLAHKKTRDQHIVDDLLALGLEVCLSRLAYFEPERGYRFSTYVNLFVKKAMDTYYKKIKNMGITYYPVAGYSMLEFDETLYNEAAAATETSETARINFLNKLEHLDREERELIERHYFKEERLIDIARNKLEEEFTQNPAAFTDKLIHKYPQYSSRKRWERIIKKEHDRIRQRLHRAELKLGKMINNEEENTWVSRHYPQPIK